MTTGFSYDAGSGTRILSIFTFKNRCLGPVLTDGDAGCAVVITTGLGVIAAAAAGDDACTTGGVISTVDDGTGADS